MNGGLDVATLLQDASSIGMKTLEHLQLTGISMGIAIIAGIPAGVLIVKVPALRGVVLSVAGVIQTIPSLAMLALLLPLFGIGFAPSICALVLYALLPIIRNTYTGLTGISPAVREAADALGLTASQKIRLVELPLALPVILAGVRTSAVICVGIATLCAFIGAGGLGDFIYTGLAMLNTKTILKGAIPAALLALLIDALFGWVENRLKVEK